jgi:1-acyl-sn-glycerol-3-phosphate acyltransferase
VAGVSIPVFFLLLALANTVVGVYICCLVPEFAMRFLVWAITHTLYRFRHRDLDRIPESGPAVLVCNHVSYMDALLIIGACRRPVRFVIYEPIYRLFLLNFIFRAARAIPIASHRTNPSGLKNAFDEIAKALENGEVVCIFPEGRLTRDGRLGIFKRGIERIVARNPVPVVPMALKGLWGSFFSHKNGRAMASLPRRFWSRVELVAGFPIDPVNVTANGLREMVLKLWHVNPKLKKEGAR